jgi:hypothetical protein
MHFLHFNDEIMNFPLHCGEDGVRLSPARENFENLPRDINGTLGEHSFTVQSSKSFASTLSFVGTFSEAQNVHRELQVENMGRFSRKFPKIHRAEVDDLMVRCVIQHFEISIGKYTLQINPFLMAPRLFLDRVILSLC